MVRAELLRLARAGAEARVAELQREIGSIYAAFPDLRRRRAPTQSGGRQTARKRRVWTAAERKAVAVRMRKYWAARKAAKR